MEEFEVKFEIRDSKLEILNSKFVNEQIDFGGLSGQTNEHLPVVYVTIMIQLRFDSLL